MSRTENQTVQIFGRKDCQATRAAERFFKERGIGIHFVDLKLKAMSPGEIRRFIDRFTLDGIVNKQGKPWIDAGLSYMKMSEAELLAKIEANPKLLNTPLARSGKLISIGKDEAAWKAMATAA